MNDDEVRQWLSADEEMHFTSALREFSGQENTVRWLRTLAETRKALAAVDPAESAAGTCGVCGNTWEHTPTCIFTTMPRPRD